jgi:hypothetical protein
MEIGGVPVSITSLGVVGLWSFIGLLILTDKLVWHARLTACKKESDQWRDIALRGLGVAEKATVHSELLVRQSQAEADTS